MSDFSSVSDLGGDSDVGSTADVNETNNDVGFGDGDGVNDFDDSEAQASQEDFEYNDDDTESDVSEEKEEKSTEETADQVESDFNDGTEVQQVSETNQFNETTTDEPVQEMSSDEYADSICADYESDVEDKSTDISDSDADDIVTEESDDGSHTETEQNDSNVQEPIENKNDTTSDLSNEELSNKEVNSDENEADDNTDGGEDINKDDTNAGGETKEGTDGKASEPVETTETKPASSETGNEGASESEAGGETTETKLASIKTGTEGASESEADGETSDVTDAKASEAVEPAETEPASTETGTEGTSDINEGSETGNVDSSEVKMSESTDSNTDDTEKNAHFENASYQQGQNEYGYLGTCGPTSISNSLNRVTGTNEYTENKVLGNAIDNNLCHKSDNPYSSGGTTTKDVVNIIDNVKNPESNIHTEVYEYDKALSVDDLANRLDNPRTVAMVGVDSATLWDQRGDVSNSGLFNHTDAPSDHWITVDSPTRDDSGNVTGFNVIDSGGGVDYVDKDKFESMYVGDSEHTVTDPTAILISKEGDSTNTYSSDDGLERMSNYKGSAVESDGGDPPSGLFVNDLNNSDVSVTKIDGQVKEIPKVALPESLSSTFTNSEYRTVETQEDVKLYRTYGGEAREGGAFATTEPSNSEEESRQKTALLPEWGNSCKYEVEITVPKGEILNIGTAEKQIDSVTGKVYCGGGDQILLPPNWFENHPDWITNVRELKEV